MDSSIQNGSAKNMMQPSKHHMKRVIIVLVIFIGIIILAWRMFRPITLTEEEQRAAILERMEGTVNVVSQEDKDAIMKRMSGQSNNVSASDREAILKNMGGESVQ